MKCPNAKSDMTPCVRRDGSVARANDGMCVGCGQVVALDQAALPTTMSNDFTQSADARDWARAFIEHYDASDDKAGFLDEGNLIGWFANAMMAKHDWLMRKFQEGATP